MVSCLMIVGLMPTPPYIDAAADTAAAVADAYD